MCVWASTREADCCRAPFHARPAHQYGYTTRPAWAIVLLDSGCSRKELRILAKGLGLDEIFIKDNANIEHYIGKIAVPLLRDLSAWLRMLPWEQALRTATDFDLLQARDEMRMFLLGFERSIPLRQQMPRDYPVWNAALREIFQSLAVEAQAALLVIWMALRSTQSF